MKIKTSELIGAALDWAVAVCENVEADDKHTPIWFESDGIHAERVKYTPATNWTQGGPIIERMGISISKVKVIKSWHWVAGFNLPSKYSSYGDTPLIAAMRCYVASKLGDEVDVPEELIK